MKRKRLGDLLIDTGLITQPQLEKALENQKKYSENKPSIDPALKGSSPIITPSNAPTLHSPEIFQINEAASQTEDVIIK